MKIKIRLGDADLDRTLSLYYCQVTGWKPPLELSTHLPLRMFFFFAQKHIIKGVADGAVK